MNYKKHYILLCERAKNRNLQEYIEKHHIIPRCLGGDDGKENIVKLTPEEHYVAHQLLVKMHPKHRGLVWAALQLAGGKTKNGGNRINNKIYGWLKRKNSKLVSLQNKERWKSPDYRDKMTEAMSKRSKEKWQDEEYKNNIIEQSKERWKCPDYRNAVVKKIKKYWSDPKNRKKASEQRKGKKNGSYGRHWYHNPKTLDNIKCLPEETPTGFIKGRTKAPDNAKCKICKTDTGSATAKYCKIHRKKQQKKHIKKNMKNVDFGGYRRKASENDIKKALTENDFNVSLSMKALGYTTDGGSARQRFQKILNRITTQM